MSTTDPNTGQLALAIAAQDKASFDNFWVGHNSELVTALKASITTGEPRVVYCYGAKGSGKSHLLFAVLRLAQQEVVPTSYYSLADSRVTPDFLTLIDVKHVVVLDDLQSWAGDSLKESALFTLFEQIKHAGGQLLVAAANPPHASGFVLRDLVSRLSSGLIYPLHELSDEQRVEALKMRAHYRGLSVSDDVIRYLVSRSQRDTTQLFAALDKIDQASLAEKRKITIPFLQDLLKR